MFFRKNTLGNLNGNAKLFSVLFTNGNDKKGCSRPKLTKCHPARFVQMFSKRLLGRIRIRS